MIKILYITFLSLIVANCAFKKVEKHHGVPFLEKKQASLVVNETNSNDIKKILGNPSTKSKFDNNVWIYFIEFNYFPVIQWQVGIQNPYSQLPRYHLVIIRSVFP